MHCVSKLDLFSFCTYSKKGKRYIFQILRPVDDRVINLLESDVECTESITNFQSWEKCLQMEMSASFALKSLLQKYFLRCIQNFTVQGGH